jgi:hypothetical protein
MVRVRCGPTGYKHASATVALTGRAFVSYVRPRMTPPVLGRAIVANEVKKGAIHRLTKKSLIQAIRHVER